MKRVERPLYMDTMARVLESSARSRISLVRGIGVLREVTRMQSAPVVIMLTNDATPECRLACRPEQSCFWTNPPWLMSWWTFSEE